jgi:hypothetical protein
VTYLKGLLFFILLYAVNQIHFKWETNVPGLAPVNLLFLLIIFAMRGKPDQIETEGILRKPLLRFYIAITFAFLWAQVRSPRDFMDDATYFKNALFFPLFYFLFLRCRQDLKTTRLLILWILVIAAVAGLEAFREGLDYGFGRFNPYRRASGPFGEDWHHANRAGVFYGMFMPMFVAVALFAKGHKLNRLGATVACVLLAGGTLATYSRQAYFLIILGTALLLIRRSIVVALVLSGILISLVGYLPDSVTQRVEETKQTNAKGEEETDASTSSRWELWAGGMGMLASNPIGVGLNRFKTEIGNYSKYKKMDAHNFYVLTVAEMGPQGLICLILVYVGLFRLAWFLRTNLPPGDPEALAFVVGFTTTVICTALGSVYGSPTFEGAIMAPFWALCGLLERYFIMRKLESGGAAPTATAEPSLVERFPLAAHIKGSARPAP